MIPPRFLTFSILLLASITLSRGAAAQSATSGGLTGVVTDPSNAVVPDANVELTDNAKGITQEKATSSTGEYAFFFVPPGNYTLEVAHVGFQTIRQVLDVNVGPPSTLNIRLLIAGTSSTVTVTGEVPLIHAENGDAASTMSALQVADVPNPGNDLTYIAQTSPGAIMNTDSGTGNFSILGMPGTSNMFTLNGMSYTDISSNGNASGASNLLLGTNSVQEATIVSNGYTGQFGVLAGSAVSYITKSGGNQFHGNADYFWNGSVLNANDWINKATGGPRPFDNANQWAASIGGPIKKDKLFFFFDTEGLILLIPVGPLSVVLPSPQFEAATIANIDSRFGSASASDAFYKQIFNLYNDAPGAATALPGGPSPQDPTGCTGFIGPNGLGTTVPCAAHYETTLSRPTKDMLFSGRVDWNARPADRLFFLLDYSRGHQATSTDPISSVFNVNSTQPGWQGQLGETHTFSSTAVNQILLAGWHGSALFGPDSPSLAEAALPTLLNWTTGTFTNVGASQDVPFGYKVTQYQFSDDFVKTWGSHKLGFGASLIRNDNPSFPGVDQGTLVPFSLDAFFQGGTDPATPHSDTTQLGQAFTSETSQPFASYEFGAYAQDEWRARSNLSLTLALRAEHQSNPVCQSRCFARLTGPFASVSHDPDQPYDQAILVNLKQAYQGLQSILWAPRFSFAWQPLGLTHSTVIRGGIGVFYDALPSIAATGSLASNPPLFNTFIIQGDNIAPNETTSLFKQTANSNSEFLAGFAAGESFAQIQEKVAGFSPPSLVSPDRSIKSPQYQKWSLEVQQAFGPNTSLSVGYFGNHGIHELIQNRSANAFGFGTLPPGECSSPPVPPCADPRFSEVTQLTTAGVSNYNGLVVSFQHRFTGWSSGIVQANYTYGHAFDEVSNGGLSEFASGSAEVPQDPNNFRGSYGPADYDVRHSFNANYVWEVPVKAALRGHGPDLMVEGWQVAGAVFARTGFPYTVFDLKQIFILEANNFFNPIYSVPVGPLPAAMPCGKGAAIPLAPRPCLPPQVLSDGVTPNPAALFIQAGCETGFNTGNLPGPDGPCSGPSVSLAQGRNHFRYPGYVDTDFSLMKNTKIPRWESGQLGIGFQAFNFFNHPNFGRPMKFSSVPSFGQIFNMESPPTGILGSGLGGDASPRNIQLKVQLQF